MWFILFSWSYSCFLFSLTLIGGFNWIYSFVVVSIIQQYKSSINIHASQPPEPPCNAWSLQSCLTFVTHGLQPTGLLCPWASSGKNIRLDCHALLQGLFPIQKLNPYLQCVLHCRQLLYPLSNLRSPLAHFSSVPSLSHVWLFATPWTAAHQASLSITNSRSLLKPMSTESMMPSNHPILCCALLLLPSIFPSIRVFSKESVLHIKWPKYWNFSFSISPSNEHSELISFRMDWLDLLAVQGTLKSLLQHHRSKA